MSLSVTGGNTILVPGAFDSYSGEQLYQLIDPLVYENPEYDPLQLVTVPRGARSDLLTIPKFWRWLIKPTQFKARRGAILHDYLIYNHSTTRAVADEVARMVWKYDGVNPLVVDLYYYSVHYGRKLKALWAKLTKLAKLTKKSG
jgi:hypothetical protein